MCLRLFRNLANLAQSAGVSIDLACASAVFFFLIFLSASKSIHGGEYPALIVTLGMCWLITVINFATHFVSLSSMLLYPAMRCDKLEAVMLILSAGVLACCNEMYTLRLSAKGRSSAVAKSKCNKKWSDAN